MTLKKIFLHPFIVTIVVIVLAILVLLAVLDFSGPPNPKGGQNVTVQVDQDDVKAIVAASPQTQQAGLAGTAPLTDEEGMLFVFDESAIQQFWMKGVSYPIDIIWIEDETVSEVTPNVQPIAAETPDAAIPKISSPYPVNRVLEVPAGWAARHNIQPGDPVTLK